MKIRQLNPLFYVAGIALGALNASAALPTGYEFDITTSYSASPPADLQNPPSPVGAPDTGYLEILNNGLTTFTGQLSLSGVSPNMGGEVTSVPGVTLAPGQHLSLSLDNESSNQGGYNSNGANVPQNGMQFTINGNVTDGVDTEAVLLQVYDKDIHSGTARDVHAAPSGESGSPLLSDSYVLQGGDPSGGDTGDAFEESQANGNFMFVERAGSNVPDAASTALLLTSGLSALALLRRKIGSL